MTSNSARGRASRARGKRAERDVANWLKTRGWPKAARRVANHGDTDIGDIVGIPFVVDVKDRADSAVPTWLAQLEAEVANSDHAAGIVVAKARGVADPASWRVHTTLEQFVTLLTEARQRAGARHVTLQPLERVLEARGHTTADAAREMNVTPRTLQRWRDRGSIPVFSADEAARALGLHPLEIWEPHEWE